MIRGPAPDTNGAADPRGVVLALNSGSSSLKFGVYRVSDSTCDILLSDGSESTEGGVAPDAAAALVRISRLLDERHLPAPSAIGHRVVHGGPRLRQHCVIDEAVMDQLEEAGCFAPVHSKAALTMIHAAREHFPDVPQVACFDTTFHVTLPMVARTLPIPRALSVEGIQRYGFHGLSCESIVRQLGEHVPSRLVIAHLGHGASITAVKDGRSIDTTMGLTPTGGLMMGTRTGDLDPGVLSYLLSEKKLPADAVEALIDRQSGLLGVSGLSSDMRRLKEAAPSNAQARLAIDMFHESASKHLAGMIVALGGVDLIVFTAGIGEHDAEARAEICRRLHWFGIVLDEARNVATTNPISSDTSRCEVRVLPSQEDEQIARHTYSLMRAL